MHAVFHPLTKWATPTLGRAYPEKTIPARAQANGAGKPFSTENRVCVADRCAVAIPAAHCPVPDTLDPAARSERMSRIRGRDTRPEMTVRRLLHSLGYRYRLHRRDLPGRPDMVFRGRRKAIFVHGCFWHRHPDPNCRLARLPKSRLEFWIPKLEANHLRDLRNQDALKAAGWSILVVWECELGDKEQLVNKLVRFLEGG
jgi:DNA mismatch endonuclease, patch repair protein